MLSHLRDAVHAARHRFHQSAPYRVYDALSGLRQHRANIPDRIFDAYRLEVWGLSSHLLTVFLEIQAEGRISPDHIRRLNCHGIVLPHIDLGDIQAQRPSHSPPLGLFQHMPSRYTPYTPDQPGDHL